MSTTSELGHLAMPTNFLAYGKNHMAQASFEPGTFRSRVLRSARCATLAWRLDVAKMEAFARSGF